ncbi:MAG: glycosyltransferase [Candidatus Omnitrophota bacterium]
METLSKSSFIICTRNRFGDIEKCIESILAQSVKMFELIIIDSSDQIGLEGILKGKFSKYAFEFIYRHTSVGLTYQRNVGISIASGDYIFFFDDDVILDVDYHEEILRAYNEHLSAMGVGGIVKNERFFSYSQTFFRKLFCLSTSSGFNNILPSGQLDYINTYKLNRVIKVDALFGCLVSFKKKVFEEFRFDESLAGYAAGEDVDFSYRVSRKYGLFLTPSATAFHNPSHISQSRPKDFMEMLILNSIAFYAKNMDKNIYTAILFLWSQIGFFLYSIVQSIKYRNVKWLKGAFSAYQSFIYRKTLKK